MRHYYSVIRKNSLQLARAVGKGSWQLAMSKGQRGKGQGAVGKEQRQLAKSKGSWQSEIGIRIFAKAYCQLPTDYCLLDNLGMFKNE